MDGTEAVPTGAHWGIYDVLVSGGRVVGARPWADDPDPAPLYAALPETVDHPTRIARPMVRAGYHNAGPRSDTAGRGAEPFVPVSWERALDLIASELERVKRAHGNEAIYAGSYGWASSGKIHHPRTLIRRLLNLHGGATDHVGNYSCGAALVVVPHILGTAAPVGMQATEWRNIGAHTELIVSFGGMAPKNLQVSFGGPGPHVARGWIERLGEVGIEAVSISPLRDDAVAALGARWLPVRPNGDTALMLGLAHTLVAEDLHDRAFLERYCTGFERFRAYLEGASDGVAKDADWAAARSDIAADEIRALARRMAAARTMITLSYSLQRADWGEQPIWMGITLACMLGQIGLPGGGFGIGYGAMGSIGNPKIAAGPRGLPCGEGPDRELYPGRAHRRHAARSRRRIRLQRQAADLSRHPHGLVGRRQPVPPPPGSQPAAARLAQAGNHRRAGPVLDARRAPCRYRAARGERAGTQRYRRRNPRFHDLRHAPRGGAGGRGAERL